MMILASSSPRRQELLRQIGVHFRVEAAAIDETPLAGEAPADYVTRLAEAKARAVAVRHPGTAVLGSDTSVVLDGQILGKPENDAQAVAMLQALSGHQHQVLTAVALVCDGRCQRQTVVTEVLFCDLSDDEIRRYVATGEPADKAGAYGIQGRGAVLVKAIHGSYSNVVGLPLTETAAMLQQAGIAIWEKESA